MFVKQQQVIYFLFTFMGGIGWGFHPWKVPTSLLDSFDQPLTHRVWSLVSDSGATGTLDFRKSAPGYHARLGWDVTKGGNWVGAQRLVDNVPANAVGIRLRAKCSSASTLWLRLVDAQNRSFEYRLTRSLTDLNEGSWFSRTLLFNSLPDSAAGSLKRLVDPATIKRLIVVAEPRMDPWYPALRWFPQPKGELLFDNLEWVTDTDERLQLITRPVKLTVTSDLWKGTGVCTHFEHGDASRPDLLREAGYQRVRADLLWHKIETKPGVYNFALFDTVAKSVETKGIRTLFILTYSNPLYTPKGSPPLTDAQIRAFARFCGAAARHFRHRPVDFEVWNEPNLKYTWQPGPDAAQFARLLSPAVDSLKAANPQARVITGGTAGIDWRFIDSLGVMGALRRVDGVGIHPYRMGSPESLSEDLLCLRWLLRKHRPGGFPEWATEYGAASSNYGNGHTVAAQQWQARIDVRAVLANWLAGFPVSMKYEFFTDPKNDPTDNESNYGIITQHNEPPKTLTRRPSYTAIQTLKMHTQNRAYLGRLTTQHTSAYALQFDGLRDRLLILYTSAGKLDTDSLAHQTRFLLPHKPLALYDYLGQPLPIPIRNGRHWPVEAGGMVVYAVVPKPM
ncbi:hypothetical protein [uncultured Fibrella sp.]|uniref:hypothetical protein n=1 Tax=uncultured Fibrella sp. TaxID=1284596 RepID=UPI0035C95BCF